MYTIFIQNVSGIVWNVMTYTYRRRGGCFGLGLGLNLRLRLRGSLLLLVLRLGLVSRFRLRLIRRFRLSTERVEMGERGRERGRECRWSA